MSEKSGMQGWAERVVLKKETAIDTGERPPSGITVWLAEKLYKPETGYETYDDSFAKPKENFFQRLSRQNAERKAEKEQFTNWDGGDQPKENFLQRLSRQNAERKAESEQYTDAFESGPKKNFFQKWLERRAASKAERDGDTGESFKDELKQAEKDRKAEEKAYKEELKQAEKTRRAEEKAEKERIKREGF